MEEIVRQLIVDVGLPLLAVVFLPIVAILIARTLLSFSKNKEVFDNKSLDNENRSKWDKELKRQGAEEEQERIAWWRKLEGLTEEEEIFKVRRTKLYSPYVTDLTDAEVDLVNWLSGDFKLSCTLVDNYFNGLHGKTTQTDCIAVNSRGIFVFESKDYSGWIFGNGNQAKWTQVLAYGRDKNRFYNPIWQNSSHVRLIRNLIKKDVPVYSIIVFGSNATLKDISYVPKDCRVCTIYRLDDALKDFKDEVLEQKEIFEICRILRQKRIKVTSELRDGHAADIKEALGEDRVYD